MPAKRICLWSSPRNLSTALMYSFAQRPDTVVFDEPLYAHYLKVTGADHPGREEIMALYKTDGDKVVREIILQELTKPVAFFKQMTHHLTAINENFLSEVNNIIFIRNPGHIISSYAQVIPDVTMADIGIEKQWQLFNRLHYIKHQPIVLDAGELVNAPEKVLNKLCAALDIAFNKKMLCWQAGPKPADGIWAKYWYTNVHQSTGFEKQQTSERSLPKHLEPLYEESKKYYNKLFPYSIKAE